MSGSFATRSWWINLPVSGCSPDSIPVESRISGDHFKLPDPTGSICRHPVVLEATFLKMNPAELDVVVGGRALLSSEPWQLEPGVVYMVFQQ